MKEVIYYKVKRDGHDYLNNFLKEICYESYTEAKSEVLDKIEAFKTYLSDKDYEIIHEYKREDMFGYFHQLVLTYKHGFCYIVVAKVDRVKLRLK